MHVLVAPCNVILLVVMSHLVSQINCGGIDKAIAEEFRSKVTKLAENENLPIILDAGVQTLANSKAKQCGENKDKKVTENIFFLLYFNGIKFLVMTAKNSNEKSSRLAAIQNCLEPNTDKIIKAARFGFTVACYATDSTLYLVLVTRLEPAEKITAAVKEFVNYTYSTKETEIVKMTTQERNEIKNCVKATSNETKTKETFSLCLMFTIGPGDKNEDSHGFHMNGVFHGRGDAGSGEVITDNSFKAINGKTAEVTISEHIKSLLDREKEAIKNGLVIDIESKNNVQWTVEYVTLKKEKDAYVYFVLALKGK